MASLPEDFDDALLVAQWRPAGRSAPGEGGAWGWCLAGDWARARMGEDRWRRAKAECLQKPPSLAAVALEDAFTRALGHLGAAAGRAGFPIVNASLRASGGPESRSIMAMAGFRAGSDIDGLAVGAVSAFFEGICHGSRAWSAALAQPAHPRELRAELLAIRTARAERGELDACLPSACASADKEGRL